MELANSGAKSLSLRFTVECSSEDVSHPHCALHHESADKTGWQSAKHCAFPQEVLLRFEGLVRIQELQILAHEYKICSRIDVSVGVVLEDTPEDEQIEWKCLGYLVFDKNEQSGFIARELKSVQLEAEADLLRLRIFGFHKNRLNTYNQVGIVAINARGESLEPIPTPGTDKGVIGNGEVAGPDQSTAAGLAIDPKTRETFLRLQRFKEIAVANEDYDEAKKLKLQIDAMRKTGERLATLESQKRAAVEAEDYDLAKQLKHEIQRLRQSGLSNPPAGTAAAATRVPSIKREPTEASEIAETPEGPAHFGGRSDQVALMERSEDVVPALLESRRSSSHGVAEISPVESVAAIANSPSFEKSKHEEYDDRVVNGKGEYGKALPATSPASDSQPRTPSNFPEGFPTDLASPEPLSASHAKAAQPLEDLAGEYVARCLYSRNWQLREAALVYLQANMRQLIRPGHEREQFRVLCQTVVKGLKDKVPNVILTSAALIRTLTSDAAAKDVQFATSVAVPILVEKLGDANPRLREAARESLLVLAKIRESGFKNMTGLFLRPPKKQAAWRPLLGRLELLTELVGLFDVGKSGGHDLDLEQLMSFVAIGCGSPNGDVRNAAVELTTKVAAIVGPTVKRYFPNDINPRVKEQLDQEVAAALGTPLSASPVKRPQRVIKSNLQTPTTGSPVSPGQQSVNEDPKILATELERKEELLGDDHPDLVEVLTNLAATYTQREEFGHAYPLLKRVLEINEKHFGFEHSNVAHALTDLAVLHMEQGQDDQGRPLLERALRIQEKNMGQDHPDVVAIRDVLAPGDA